MNRSLTSSTQEAQAARGTRACSTCGCTPLLPPERGVRTSVDPQSAPNLRIVATRTSQQPGCVPCASCMPRRETLVPDEMIEKSLAPTRATLLRQVRACAQTMGALRAWRASWRPVDRVVVTRQSATGRWLEGASRVVIIRSSPGARLCGTCIEAPAESCAECVGCT